MHYPLSEGKVTVFSGNLGFTAGLDVPGGRNVRGEGGGGAGEGDDEIGRRCRVRRRGCCNEKEVEGQKKGMLQWEEG